MMPSPRAVTSAYYREGAIANMMVYIMTKLESFAHSSVADKNIVIIYSDEINK